MAKDALAWLLAAGCFAAWATTSPMAIALPVAAPQVTDQQVVVLSVKGTVEILRAGRRSKASPNDRLLPGDRLAIAENSRATLLWYGRSEFQLSEATVIEIPPPAGAKKRSRLNLLKGLLFFFHRDEPSDYDVQTPTAWAVVRGTEFTLRVEDNLRTTLSLIDGQAELVNELGKVILNRGDEGVVDQGQAPVRRARVEAINDLIQWFLYYPAVVDPDELDLSPGEQEALAESLTAYRSGDLPRALTAYPTDREPASVGETIYRAALLLTVGQVSRAVGLLDSLDRGEQEDARATACITALRQIIAVVKGQTELLDSKRPISVHEDLVATALLADSYLFQARDKLEKALDAARRAAERSSRFGFAWARVAELEFSFGRTKAAFRALDRALELSPRNAEAHALRGFVLAAQDRTSDAIRAFEQALAIDRELGNAWLGLGLCRIRRGQEQAGRQDLAVAAALEPQRSLLRSYLGKAYGQAGDLRHATNELRLARTLDSRDPTPWLYSALLAQQENRINEAVRDLERSQELNDNRRLYRSRLLLDQDRAVRSANLASVFHDAGMTDVSVREASRAVAHDYANYSAHLFLANSFDRLRDPRQINLRYETPWLSEYLLANLLAPVSAGTLSQTVSAQEYSKLFERNRLGLVSRTEYLSRGDWTHSVAQYGLLGRFSYSLDAFYRSENGEQPHSDLEQLNLAMQFKQQIGPQDTIYLQAARYSAETGDVRPHYDPAMAQRGLRTEETQEPLLVAGWHHDWAPGQHTLALAGWVRDRFSLENPRQPTLALGTNAFPYLDILPQGLTYESEQNSYTTEIQQIWRQHAHTAVFGGRHQGAEFDTRERLAGDSSMFIGATSTNISPSFQRESLYIYDHWQVFEPLTLIAGLSYDRLKQPANFRSPPLSEGETRKDQLSPKAGLVWDVSRNTTVRAAWTRSLGGVSLDQSFQLEPSQVAGFQQSFRSLIPEAVAGAIAAPSFETWGLALDQKFPTGTYVGLSGQWLVSKARRDIGMFVQLAGPPPLSTIENVPSSAREDLRFEEKTLAVTLNQLVGQEWSLGARYGLSHAELSEKFPKLPDVPEFNGAFHRKHTEGTLHQLDLFALFHHPSGFFARTDAVWWSQSNKGYSPGRPGDDFWQFHAQVGYRFTRRRAEVRLGLLNILDQDYRLNPLNLTTTPPRERTMLISLLLNF